MLEIMRKRRSIRKYTDESVPVDMQKLLLEALLRAPSGRNAKPCEFVFVTDREQLKALSCCKPHGGTFLKGAALGVVICGNEKISDTWIEDCSIAATFLQLVAEELGLGSCWVQIRGRQHSEQRSAEEYTRGLLNIPDYIRVEAIIALGYPDEKKEPVEKGELDLTKIKVGVYQQTF